MCNFVLRLLTRVIRNREFMIRCFVQRIFRHVQSRRLEATEMDALRRSSRISRKVRIRNVTIRQKIGLEETMMKVIEQNQLT